LSLELKQIFEGVYSAHIKSKHYKLVHDAWCMMMHRNAVFNFMFSWPVQSLNFGLHSCTWRWMYFPM